MFIRRVNALFLCLLTILVGASAAAAAEGKNGAADNGAAAVVAKIGNDEVITKEEFDRAIAAFEQGRMAMMRQRGPSGLDPGAVRLKHEDKLKLLDTLVDSRIALILAREAGTTVSDEEVKADIEKSKTNLPSGTDYATFLKQRGLTEQEVFERTKQKLITRAFEESKTKDISVSDDDVKAQFEKLKARGIMDDFDVQHILVKAPQGNQAALDEAKKKIDAVYDRLKKGEDFTTVAKEVSEDDGSKAKGGEYKGVRRGQMVPEFDQRMASATVGEISEPFTSQYGWHILKVNRHGAGELSPDLAKRIKQQMLLARQKTEMRRLVQEKRGTLDITINMPAEAPSDVTATPDAADDAKDLDALVDAAS